MSGGVIYETSPYGIFIGMNMNMGGMGANANMRGKRASAGKIVCMVV